MDMRIRLKIILEIPRDRSSTGNNYDVLECEGDW